MAKRRNMQKRNNRIKLERAAETFISQNIERLAGLAWEGHETSGRGFVLIYIAENDYLMADYISRDHPAWDDSFEDVADLIDEYDPKTQFVVVNTVPANTEAWIAGDLDVPPPIAHGLHSE